MKVKRIVKGYVVQSVGLPPHPFQLLTLNQAIKELFQHPIESCIYPYKNRVIYQVKVYYIYDTKIKHFQTALRLKMISWREYEK